MKGVLSFDHRVRNGIMGYLLGSFHKYDIEKDYWICLARWYKSNIETCKHLGIQILFDKAVSVILKGEGKYYFGSNKVRENEVRIRGYDVDNYNASLNLSSLFVGLENRYLFDYSKVKNPRGFYNIETRRVHENGEEKGKTFRYNGKFSDYRVIRKYISRGTSTGRGDIRISPETDLYKRITRINVICGVRISEEFIDSDAIVTIKTQMSGVEMQHRVEIYKKGSHWYIDLPYYIVCCFSSNVNHEYMISIHTGNLAIHTPFQYDIIYVQVLISDFDGYCIAANVDSNAYVKSCIFEFEAVRISPRTISLTVKDKNGYSLCFDQNMIKKIYALGFSNLYTNGDGIVRDVFISCDDNETSPSLYQKYYTINGIKNHIADLYQLRYDIIRKPLGKFIKRDSVGSLLENDQRQLIRKLITHILFMYNIKTLYDDRVFFKDIKRIEKEDDEGDS